MALQVLTNSWVQMLLLSINVHILIAYERQVYKRDVAFEKMSLNASELLLRSSYQTDIPNCALKCSETPFCVSVLHNRDSLECKLLKAGLTVGYDGLEELADGWAYYARDVECEPGWHLYNGHCYIAITLDNSEDKSYDAANVSCTSHSAYVVEIDSIEENTWLRKIFFGKSYYLGATRSGNSPFIWSYSGITMYFSFWKIGEPSNDEALMEDCVAMKTSNNGYWVSITCDKEFSHICEKNM